MRWGKKHRPIPEVGPALDTNIKKRFGDLLIVTLILLEPIEGFDFKIDFIGHVILYQ